MVTVGVKGIFYQKVNINKPVSREGNVRPAKHNHEFKI